MSLLAIKEHDELQEKFETERKLKNAIVVEAQRVSHFSSHNHINCILTTEVLCFTNQKSSVMVVLYRLQIESERRAVIRQSSAAILEASSDEKLRKAFENIEQLSKELGEAQAKLRQQVHSSSHVL